MKREEHILCITPTELVQESYHFIGGFKMEKRKTDSFNPEAIDVIPYTPNFSCIETMYNYITGESNIKNVESNIERLVTDYFKHNKSFNIPIFQVLRESIQKLSDSAVTLNIYRWVENDGKIIFKINDIPLINQIPYIKNAVIIISSIYYHIENFWLNIEHQGSYFDKYAIVLIKDIEQMFKEKTQHILILLKTYFPYIKLILK